MTVTYLKLRQTKTPLSYIMILPEKERATEDETGMKIHELYERYAADMTNEVLYCKL